MRVRRIRWSGPGLRLLLIVLALTIVAVPSLVMAQSTEQRQTPPSPARSVNPALLDLAAATLSIQDLEAVGLEGYGIGSGQERSLRTTAEVLADNRGGISPENVERFAAFLEEVNWQRGYESGLAVLREDDPGYFAQVISSTIDVYATEADADDAFTRYSDPEGVTIADVEEIPGNVALGDDSRVWLVEGEAEDTGQPFQAVLVMFRTGTIEAAVGIYNWEEDPPDVTLAETLAGRLLERIEAMEPAARPPLSSSVLAFGELGINSYYHNYLRYDGIVIPFAGEDIEALANRSLAYRNAAEVYTVNQVFPAREEGPADDGYYALWRYRFEDNQAATDWFSTEAQRFLSSVTELPIGDQAFAYSYALEVADGQYARGYVGYLLVGRDVAIIDTRAVPEVPLVSFAEIMQMQAACMDSEVACPLADIPYHLRQYLTPEPEEDEGATGTPDAEATPVAPDATPDDGATPEADATPVAPLATPEAFPDEERNGDD